MSEHPIERMIDFLEKRIMDRIDRPFDADDVDVVCRQIDTLSRLYIVKQHSVKMERMRKMLDDAREEGLQ